MTLMTVHRSTHARAWGTAAAAAFIAGLATTAGAVAAEPIVLTRSEAVTRGTSTATGARVVDVIALRPDPANLDRLVVDFGAGAPGGSLAKDPSTAIDLP